MRRARIVLLIAALGASHAQAGLFDDDEARRQINDNRIQTEARVDQLGKSQLDLANQLQGQSEEIARLRGQVETLTYELETARKRQQDFYLDLDIRLRKFEPQGGGAAAVDGEKTPNSGAGAQGGAEPDIDLTRIKSGSALVRTILFVLNGVKVPLPGIEVRSTGRVLFHGLAF